ncbi:CYFA0S02e05292g1_1 [Cyberlindnera fabianii]|uniref:CYFA0S02e05292g1_1 n=1 Tax=Cyberlindnera fabianii TaxID=36022 RepID=A0A061AVJ1_CYBFA|nr:hypothetical protein BON22_0111 [Cyberlindnera fabianii]CDR38751.1 CYFA0S02e05292g1_1 [Cyberlindnera fabianii]
MVFKFSTEARTLLDIPTDPKQFVQDADALVGNVESSWKKHKTYTYKLDDGSKESVTTYGTNLNGEYWLSRVSSHAEKTFAFDKMAKYLLGADKTESGEYSVIDLYKHTEYETDYIHVLSKWDKVPLESYDEFAKIADDTHLKRWASIRAEYELGAPLTTREFNEFIMIVEPGYINDCGYVIQLVSNRVTSTGHVKGVYCSIERIRKVGDEVEWIMCTCSDSGGNVPKWLQNSMISKSVAADVPSFLNWVKRQK